MKGFGFWVTLGVFLDHLKLAKYHVLGIFLHDLKGFSSETFDRAAKRSQGFFDHKLTAKEILQEDLNTLNFAVGLHPMEFIKKRFEDKARLFAVMDEHKVLGMCFSTTFTAELSSVKRPVVRVPDGMVYTFGAIVSTAHKQKGLGTYVMQTVLQNAGKEGKTHAFLAAALKLDVCQWHLANGYKLWGYLHRIKCLGLDACQTQLAPTGNQYAGLLSA